MYGVLVFSQGYQLSFPLGRDWWVSGASCKSMQFQGGERCHSHGDDGGVGEPSQGCQSLAYKVHYKCHHLTGLFLQK